MGIIFALSAIPMICVAGAAYDYSRAYSVRTAMQVALDATALGISKDAPNKSASELQTAAQNYFSIQFHQPDASNVSVNAVYSAENSSVTVTANTSVKTTLLSLLRIPSIKVADKATATWGLTKLQVALVLHNTGSMKQSDATGVTKISAFKKAGGKGEFHLPARFGPEGHAAISSAAAFRQLEPMVAHFLAAHP